MAQARSTLRSRRMMKLMVSIFSRCRKSCGYEAVTNIANTPGFIKGVINLRGVIVPVIDLRIKFHLPHVVYNELTVVIVLNICRRVIGMAVDGVSDVFELAQEQIHAAPEFGSSLDTPNTSSGWVQWTGAWLS